MANVKRIFHNHPYINASGSYTFLEQNNYQDYYHSDSIPTNYDKFSKKDLYSLSVGDTINEKIIESWKDEAAGTYSRLKYNQTSFVRIDTLYLAFNGGISGKTNGTRFHGFMVSDKALRENSPKLSSIKKSDGSYKSYGDLYDMIFTDNDPNDTLDELGEFWDWDPGVYDEGSPDPGVRIENEIIIQNLNDGVVNTGPTPTINENRADFDSSHFKPADIFRVGNTDGGTITKIFDESIDRASNTIYFIFRLAANREGEDRNNRIHIYEINPEELFNDVNGMPAEGKLTTFDLGQGVIVDQTSKDLKPAFKLTEFRVTINTAGGAGGGYNPNPIYGNITGSVLPPQRVNPISTNDISENILEINPAREIKYTPTENFDGLIANEFTNYFPVSEVTIGDTDVDVQIYYENEQQRQIASSPTSIGISFYISDYGNNGSILQNRSQLANADNSKYLFFIVDWNDVDDKFKTVNDVLADFPTNRLDLLSKQEDNIYIVEDIEKKLFNNYTSPGIKTIKALMFNCVVDANTNIEPIRWKLITTRIFLDIPVSEFPDFGEVGGNDYTTIPWPYITPVIGGVSQNSKYIKSIKDTLGSGKISTSDIIDETFLYSAKENDEIGVNIEKLDLEQVRYFNQSYDMNTLLNIPIENNFYPNPYTNIGSGSYWDGSTIERTFSEESSVGQIFISDNQDKDLIANCKLELNTGELSGKSIIDSSGNSNKGLLIGDYKIKKTQKNEPMRRDSFIKIPKKASNRDGAL